MTESTECNECPICKIKGQLIEDQFIEVRYCKTVECPIIQYQVLNITAHLGGWTR